MAEAPGSEESADEGLVTATLAYLAGSIAEHPDDVEVSTSPGDGGAIVFRLKVNQEDMGRIIGRRGRTARAIRQVTRAAAAKAGIHAIIEIVD
jgi:hypothetical protein